MFASKLSLLLTLLTIASRYALHQHISFHYRRVGTSSIPPYNPQQELTRTPFNHQMSLQAKDTTTDSDPIKETSTPSSVDESSQLPVPTSEADAKEEPVDGEKPDAVENMDEKPMSKKQMKKRKRHEKLMDIKKRKKEQAKEVKAAKAEAEGRDLDAERLLQEEREKSGVGRKKRAEMWARRMKSAETSFQVCIDCGFEDLMTRKETNSLANQIRFCYAMNKLSDNPVYITMPNLTESGETYGQLSKVQGFPEWKARSFSCSAEPLEEVHPDKSKLVYLTSDSDNTIQHLDDSKIYVIGGIVDRNRLKGLSNEKAQKLGITTARLPIDDHLKLVATKVLTVNHVFEILLKYRQHGNDWKKALLDVLPTRKDITEVDAAAATAKEETGEDETKEETTKSS